MPMTLRTPRRWRRPSLTGAAKAVKATMSRSHRLWLRAPRYGPCKNFRYALARQCTKMRWEPDSRLHSLTRLEEPELEDPKGPAESRTMNQPIRTHEITGLKIFNTRAAKASEKIAGKGYSPVADQSLITLPPPPPGAAFNAEEQAKYREFKEARRGAADYMAMEGEFSRYLEEIGRAHV